jgi:dipeptidase E
MRSVFDTIGVELIGLHSFPNPSAAVEDAEAIVVGGGNTFRLVKALHELGLMEGIRRAVARGIPYWGASAGSNVACPTIRTTNDMPIVEPPNFRGFGLVPFQINPHYVDPDTDGETVETREYRINEFLDENDVTVVGLREGSWLVAEGSRLALHGDASAMIFRRGSPPTPIQPTADVSFLLNESSRFDTPVPRSIPTRI